MEYFYNNLSGVPTLAKIHVDVKGSEMTDKNIDSCSFDGSQLKIIFDNELSAGDKTLLDTIVDNSLDQPYITKSKIEILDEIFSSASTEGDPPTQQDRFISVLNSNPIFIVAIESAVESGQWAFARGLIQSDGTLTADDKTLMLGILPE